jgi:hypothetical protein
MTQQTMVNMLIWELESWFHEIVQKLYEISMEEAKWKPTANSKTVKILNQWYGKDNDWISEQFLDSISTIEFKVVHLAQNKHKYNEYAFREGSRNWTYLECPEWPNCVDYLRKTQKSLVASLRNLTDEQLDDMVPTHWGELWPIKRIIPTMIYHDAYHFGQINTVRNLYNIANK